MNEDSDLLRRYVELRSEEAFAELVQRRIGLVYSIAYRKTRDPHRAKDVAQTVFVQLARKAASLARHTVLVGWLYRTTHYAAIDVIRAEQSRVLREQKVQAMQAILVEDESNADWEKIRPTLDEVIGILDTSDRDAILLRFFDQRSFSEIGERLHLTENAARMRVTRALEKMRLLLQKRGIQSTSTILATALGSQGAVVVPAGLAVSIASQSVAVAGYSATALGLFMSTPFVVVGVLAVAGFGAFAYQLARTNRLEAKLAAAQREQDGLRSSAELSQRRAAEAEQLLGRLRSENEAARARASAPVVAAAVAKSGVNTSAPSDEKSKLARVALEVAHRRTVRLQNMDTTYRALYQKLGFAPDDIALFKSLMTSNSKKAEELLNAAISRGGDVQAAMNESNAEAAADLREKIQGAFGDAAYEAFQHFNDTLVARGMTERVASTLFYTDAPLSLPQVEQLVEIVSKNMPKPGVKLDSPSAQSAVIESISAQAQAVLTEPQLSILKQMLLQSFGASEAVRP